MGFLDGVKVIDFTHAYAGPFCSLNLADFGAEVIKVERIDGGDQARTWGPFKNDYSAYYASFNRGKKSITLNIASPEGKEIIFNLVKDADIVCSNFKAGTLEKYGITYDEMKKIKPDIIYASISGFGTEGVLSKFAAYDNVIQALSGIMDVNGFEDKVPTKIGPAIGDSYSGLILYLGIFIAYYHRLRTGHGQKVDATMLGSLYTLLEYPILEYTNNGKILSRSGNTSHYCAPADIFQVKDGYIALTVKNDVMWQTFCEKMSLQQLLGDEDFQSNEKRVANKQRLKEMLLPAFAQKTMDEMEGLFSDTQIPVSAVIDIVKSLEDPHLLARKMVIEVNDPVIGPLKLVGNPMKLSENEPILDVPSPTLGEHTGEILASLGYKAEEITQLKERNVV
ncbi:MAG: CaiB/BaiF CoA-transferase family protein [Anaerotignum sp.]|nr:CaiB/BaiF CoA-transferase family protein [Anaerotignum sp.]